MFHRHDWVVVNEYTSESMFSAALKAASSDQAVRNIKLPHQLCDGERKHILTVKCKCGKIKQFVNTI